MKRSLMISLLVFVSLSLLAGVSVIGINNHEHHHASGQSKQELRAAVNGQNTPNLIPQDAAYEILFKLLSTGDEGEDKDGKIRSSYLKQAGFDEVESAALKAAAYEYKPEVATLNSEAKRIKDTHWPKPGKEARDNLAQLQKEKEKIINRAANNLLNTPFFRGNSIAKLNQVVNEKIKRKTTGYSTELPPQKISFLEKLLRGAFVVEAQGCSAYIYLYADSWQGYNNVTGASTTSESYNTCSHDINQSIIVSGSGYTSTPGTNYTWLSLEQGSVLLDGNFTTTADLEVTCTHTPGVIASNYAYATETVDPYVRLKTKPVPNKSSILNGGDVTYTVTYEASQGASQGTFTAVWALSATCQLQYNDFTLPANETISVGGGFSITGVYELDSNHKGKMVASIELQDGTIKVRDPKTQASDTEVICNAPITPPCSN